VTSDDPYLVRNRSCADAAGDDLAEAVAQVGAI
jgi:hypothetical protein